MDDYVCICNMASIQSDKNKTHAEMCQVYNKGIDAERARIVGLFDAALKNISEGYNGGDPDYYNELVMAELRDIFDGLRK